METKKQRLRRIVRIAYEKPLSPRWRKDTISVFPGWAFDLLVVGSCVTFASHYFFGVGGVIGALFISFTLFFVMENNKKKAARKAEETPASAPETAATDAATAAKRQPVKTFRVDDCSASVWVRETQVRGEFVKFYSVTFERAYTDRSGARGYTKTFNLESLGKVVTLCQQVSEWHQSLQQ